MSGMDSGPIDQLITRFSVDADSILIIEEEADLTKINQIKFDFVLIKGLLEKINKEKAENMIAQMRDVHARQLLLIKNETSKLNSNDLIRLGLRKVAEFDQNDQLCEAWYFALETYKKVPDWLNDRFWANPELYEKYRW